MNLTSAQSLIYAEMALAKSSAGNSQARTVQKGTQVPSDSVGAFFASEGLSYGVQRGETFGSAGFLFGRSCEPRVGRHLSASQADVATPILKKETSHV